MLCQVLAECLLQWVAVEGAPVYGTFSLKKQKKADCFKIKPICVKSYCKKDMMLPLAETGKAISLWYNGYLVGDLGEFIIFQGFWAQGHVCDTLWQGTESTYSTYISVHILINVCKNVTESTEYEADRKKEIKREWIFSSWLHDASALGWGHCSDRSMAPWRGCPLRPSGAWVLSSDEKIHSRSSSNSSSGWRPGQPSAGQLQ